MMAHFLVADGFDDGPPAGGTGTGGDDDLPAVDGLGDELAGDEFVQSLAVHLAVAVDMAEEVSR
jgi:hypothetical protein